MSGVSVPTPALSLSPPWPILNLLLPSDQNEGLRIILAVPLLPCITRQVFQGQWHDLGMGVWENVQVIEPGNPGLCF